MKKKTRSISRRASLLHPDEEAIPFVPAYDLLERVEAELSEEEAAAVAMIIHEILYRSRKAEDPAGWKSAARIESIRNS